MKIIDNTRSVTHLGGIDEAALMSDSADFTGVNGVTADDSSSRMCRGYGACSKSSCNCQEYEGSDSTCGNNGCGHSYSDHW